jgi:hypothetical protein
LARSTNTATRKDTAKLAAIMRAYKIFWIISFFGELGMKIISLGEGTL